MMNISTVELERLTDQCQEAGVYHEFRELVDLGNSPRFAAMLALQSPPGTKNTDRAFSQGQYNKMERMAPLTRAMLQARAKKAGIDTSGKFYIGGALKATDPAAWVTCAEDVLTVCKAKNLNADGVLNYKAVEKETPPPDVRLAPKLVREFERKALRSNPSLAARVRSNPAARRELREQIIEKHGKRKRVKANRRLAR